MLIHVCALHNTCQVTQSYVVVRAVSVPQQVDTVLTQLTHVAVTPTQFTNASIGQLTAVSFINSAQHLIGLFSTRKPTVGRRENLPESSLSMDTGLFL